MSPPFLPNLRRGLAALLLALSLSATWAQAPTPAKPAKPGKPPPPNEPQELIDLRQLFLRKANDASQLLNDQFSKALGNLERDLAATGDYDQALAAQRRRLDIGEALKAAQADAPLANAQILRAADAKLLGAVYYDKATDTLNGWRKGNGEASWDLAKLTPGAYEVVMHYSVGTGTEAPHFQAPATPAATGSTPDYLAGGEFDLYEDSSLVGAEANHRTGSVESTGGWSTFASLKLDPLHLQHTAARIVLHADKVKGGGGLMSLKDIRLTPVAPEAPPTPALSVTEESDRAELTKLEEVYAQRIKAIAQPITDTYLATLTDLEHSLTQQQDTDGLAALALERDRVAKWEENPTAPPPARSTAFRSALSSAGLTELADDARFVPDATNAGDLFRVTHDGKAYSLRLLWVTCPPPQTDNKSLLDRQARYFGIKPEDAAAAGKEAADFTAGLLADKPLRILSDGQRDAQGRYFVVVVPEGMDDLATILVENGLAAINPAPDKKHGFRRYEKAVLESLKDREKAVKQRPIPPGAWGYVAAPAKSASAP